MLATNEVNIAKMAQNISNTCLITQCIIVFNVSKLIHWEGMD